MILSERDLDEFAALSASVGVKLSQDQAREAATRLLLVYQTIARPTPSELQAAGLAKSGARVIVSDESNIHNHATL